MKKKKFVELAEQSEEMSLQITSMADIFTIILVFLLKSYSAGVSTLVPEQGTVLPEGRPISSIQDTLKMEILKSGVLVNGNPVGPSKGQYEEVYQALMRERSKKALPDGDSKLLLLADQHTPYASLKGVMNSAARAGFVDLQLVVAQPD